jgi:hypothetical protein
MIFNVTMEPKPQCEPSIFAFQVLCVTEVKGSICGTEKFGHIPERVSNSEASE